ncbi:hypothetical protein [Sphingobacterium hungaricum]|uniref:Uncharacterized protein n=1 Tax=Sphingobacterium hungaricum TaxID=2082723 RepID=A0A928UVS7_9SPHI|nr:hypothetical protein [Sphingobacterium hungaricum]MBE8713858.1 hypothetical protein [Sphingobacterium hungaricum]
MLRFNRKNLLAGTYLLLVSLLLLAAFMVMHFESPERLIEGQWVETGWYMEKSEAVQDQSSWELQASLREEIMNELELFNVQVWEFDSNGTIRDAEHASDDNMQWFIRGRGHILQLVKDGKQVESFQIAKINKDTLELHLNLDLQIKGVLKIILERKGLQEDYAKKI